jgi:hypothetical protein
MYKDETTTQLYCGKSDVSKETVASVFRIKIQLNMGNTQNSRKFSATQVSVQSRSADVATVSPTHHPVLTKLWEQDKQHVDAKVK